MSRQLISAALLALAVSPAAAQSRSSLAEDAVLFGGSAVHAVSGPLRWSEPEWRTAGRALVVLAALSSLDGAGRDFMREHQTRGWNDAALVVERLGTVQNFAVLAGLFTAGLLLDDAKPRAVAVEGIASSLVAGALITPALQRIFGRSRPRRGEAAHTFDFFSGNISLPSGHTTQAFAVASVIATEYDGLPVQLLSYGLATGVAVARMYHDAHFLSDVAAAALIGTVVGRSVARFGQSRRGRIELLPPSSADETYAVQLSIPVR